VNPSSFRFVVISESFLDFFIRGASIAQKLKLVRLDPDLKTIVLVNSHKLKIKLRSELDIDKALKDVFKLNKQIGQILLIFEFFKSFFKGLVMVLINHVKIEVFFEDLFKSNDIRIIEFFNNWI
jgi:ethanolamine utilization protein EutA (predicted chaperonin)